jgi:hypothetical protein
MGWLLAVLAAVAGLAAVGVGARLCVNGKEPSVNRLIGSGREGLRLLLERVEREDPPELVRGAMCYRTAALPDRFEYLCPSCGTRTWYAGDEAGFLAREAEAMRRAMADLQETPYFRAFLDESAFCSSCSFVDADQVPRFVLAVVYREGDTVRTPVGLYDLQILDGLVRGELSFTDSYDARLPLKDMTDRLRAMLDIQR